jgi:hypothetical protein
VLCDVLEDALDVLLETLLEHLVGLVQHGHLQAPQLYHPPLQQVQQSPGRGHNHVGAISHFLNLLVDISPSIHVHHVELRALVPDAHNLVLYLNSQLPELKLQITW